MTMRELRKARKITQVQLAKKLGVKQEQVSRSEKRVDLHLSTLKGSLEAMGGTLTRGGIVCSSEAIVSGSYVIAACAFGHCG
jgi:transcriptional regulator with XRE-family HTH domain